MHFLSRIGVIRICAAVISYKNLTREIASSLIRDKKRKDNGYFFVDDELNPNPSLEYFIIPN